MYATYTLQWDGAGSGSGSGSVSGPGSGSQIDSNDDDTWYVIFVCGIGAVGLCILCYLTRMAWEYTRNRRILLLQVDERAFLENAERNATLRLPHDRT